VSSGTTFSLRLYIAGEGPNSVRARSNLLAFCQQHLPGSHEVEVIDVLRDPQRALADGVFLTPLLVKLAPGPTCRIVGNLSDVAPLRVALGLPGPG
jgi:circadian clock protein KaiB